MERDRGDRGRSSFHQARSRFDNNNGGGRKRKTSYPEEGDQSNRRGRDHERDDSRRGGDDRRDDRDRGVSRTRGGPRSHSVPRWERGKKQQKKTQTEVPPERELFVGNIPSNLDERFLLHFLNGAMRHANLVPKHETPCLSCQINNGNFAFVELLNADLANKCLNLNGSLFLNSRIKVGRPKKYAGPFVVTKTWQELTGESLTVDAVLDSEQEKVNRELFVGNTTPEMTEQMLMDFLGSAMEQVGLHIMDGNPITTCELFGKYAFIELRTPREAANALNLNNIPFMGSNLQITRPSKWKGSFEKHQNWEHVLARFNMKPEEFQLGQILNPAVIASTPTEPVEGENINVIKAELAQVRRALEITRHQLDESNKKSEARKEQLVSLNRKWSEGKFQLTERKQELFKVKDELTKKRVTIVDMDAVVDAQEMKKKHQETQGMLRGVTESLVKATEKLQSERKVRKSLEMQLSSRSGFDLEMEEDEEAEQAAKKQRNVAIPIDFASIRAEMGDLNTEMEPETSNETPIADNLETPKQNGHADAGAGAGFDAGADAGMEDHDMEDDDEQPKLDSLKEFLAKTPKTEIDWGTPRASLAATPRSRDRAGVRLCRLLIHIADMNEADATEVETMAGKYNLGGYIMIGKPGLVVVEGLEFNCDIFMDNMERQKKKYTNAGKVSERSGRAFPQSVTQLVGNSAVEDFSKACESVGLKDKLDSVLMN